MSPEHKITSANLEQLVDSLKAIMKEHPEALKWKVVLELKDSMNNDSLILPVRGVSTASLKESKDDVILIQNFVEDPDPEDMSSAIVYMGP